MAPLSSQELRNWYAKFKKEVYEKANIDMDRVEDLGRIKNFYLTKWETDQLLGPEGDLVYACIPHEKREPDNVLDNVTTAKEYIAVTEGNPRYAKYGPPPENPNQMEEFLEWVKSDQQIPEYTNTPPSIDKDPDKYLEWVQNNLQVPKTDEQLQQLYNMSREGSLMIFAPGTSESNMQQIYTDEAGNITTTLQMNTMVAHGTRGVDPKFYLPPEPIFVKDPDPAEYGLPPMPVKPQPPANMNPSVWSMIAHKLFGVDNDYAKKVRYEEDMADFQKKWEAWNKGMSSDNPKVQEYNDAMKARQDYVAEAEQYAASPLGKVVAYDNGLRGFRTNKSQSEVKAISTHEANVRSFLLKELQFMKKLHSKLPQGEILTNMEALQEKMNLAKRTKTAMKELLGNTSTPNDMAAWRARGVYKKQEEQPYKYTLPALPSDGTYSIDERVAFRDRFSELAQMAGFAALAQPEVLSEPLMEGLNIEQTYSKVLKGLITVGVPNSDNCLPYVHNARAMAHQAIVAYSNGDEKPLADLMMTSILRNNREIANMPAPDMEQSMNTLYTIGRLWNVLNDPQNQDLKKTVLANMSDAEIKETEANIALYKTINKSLEAKQKLMAHALYKNELSPDQLKEAACDVLLESYVRKEFMASYNSQTEAIMETPAFKAAQTDRQRSLLLSAHTAPSGTAKLLDENWVNNMKTAMRRDLNLDAMVSMKREDLGKLFASKDGLIQAVAPMKNPVHEPAREIEEPVRNMSGMAMG